MISKTYNCSKLEFYMKFFELLNVIQSNTELKLQKREIEVLSHFLLLPEIEFKHKRFKPIGQKIVKEKLDTSIDNIKTTLTKLIKKKYIVPDFDKVNYLHPNIKKVLDTVEMTKTFDVIFKFNINE